MIWTSTESCASKEVGELVASLACPAVYGSRRRHSPFIVKPFNVFGDFEGQSVLLRNVAHLNRIELGGNCSVEFLTS